jgi:hypothetical protein
MGSAAVTLLARMGIGICGLVAAVLIDIRTLRIASHGRRDNARGKPFISRE